MPDPGIDIGRIHSSIVCMLCISLLIRPRANHMTLFLQVLSRNMNVTPSPDLVDFFFTIMFKQSTKILDSENRLTGIASQDPERSGTQVGRVWCHTSVIPWCISLKASVNLDVSWISDGDIAGIRIDIRGNTFIWNILLLSSPDISQQTSLPFFAAPPYPQLLTHQTYLFLIHFFHKYFSVLLFSIGNEAPSTIQGCRW